MIELKATLFSCCIALLLVVNVESFSLCPKRKNLTIVPHIDVYHQYKEDEWFLDMLENSAMQLKYFIKSLLETSCLKVWFYSPVQNRCICLTEENYVRFLDTEWMAIQSTDDDDILNLLSDIPQSNEEMEQATRISEYRKACS